jgi:hypothetical protein
LGTIKGNDKGKKDNSEHLLNEEEDLNGTHGKKHKKSQKIANNSSTINNILEQKSKDGK